MVFASKYSDLPSLKIFPGIFLGHWRMFYSCVDFNACNKLKLILVNNVNINVNIRVNLHSLSHLLLESCYIIASQAL